MKYLHTMVRVLDVEKSLDFYCNKLGLKEIARREDEQGRFTLFFLAPQFSLLGARRKRLSSATGRVRP